MKTLQIDILDDDEFFVKVIHERLTRFAVHKELSQQMRINIHSYANYTTYLRRYQQVADIAILDYNLGSGMDARSVIKLMGKKPRLPKFILISADDGMDKLKLPGMEAVDTFVKKDENLIPQCCLIIEEFINQKFAS